MNDSKVFLGMRAAIRDGHNMVYGSCTGGDLLLADAADLVTLNKHIQIDRCLSGAPSASIMTKRPKPETFRIFPITAVTLFCAASAIPLIPFTLVCLIVGRGLARFLFWLWSTNQVPRHHINSMPYDFGTTPLARPPVLFSICCSIDQASSPQLFNRNIGEALVPSLQNCLFVSLIRGAIKLPDTSLVPNFILPHIVAARFGVFVRHA